MSIFELYKDKSKHSELAELFNAGAQLHPHGLSANFLEKDVWVTEVLRLLYDEKLLDDFSVAFKGGTALSKCWRAIERFSEDIDLSVHWADLSGLSEDEEVKAWIQSTQNNSQIRKFRKAQQKRLKDWTNGLVERLNQRFSEYEIHGLYAEPEEKSHGEKIDIHFPRTTKGQNDYQLDHILLEFGGRNRGKPTKPTDINCYLDINPTFAALNLPKAKVSAFQKDYIFWEKLTALHQFSTQAKEPNPDRLARHWYDVDCLLTQNFANAFETKEAMLNVVEMKKHRWAEPGVNYDSILQGSISLIPEQNRLKAISSDHQKAIAGKMFFTEPDPFNMIVERLYQFQQELNQHLKHRS